MDRPLSFKKKGGSGDTSTDTPFIYLKKQDKGLSGDAYLDIPLSFEKKEQIRRCIYELCLDYMIGFIRFLLIYNFYK